MTLPISLISSKLCITIFLQKKIANQWHRMMIVWKCPLCDIIIMTYQILPWCTPLLETCPLLDVCPICQELLMHWKIGAACRNRWARNVLDMELYWSRLPDPFIIFEPPKRLGSTRAITLFVTAVPFQWYDRYSHLGIYLIIPSCKWFRDFHTWQYKLVKFQLICFMLLHSKVERFGLPFLEIYLGICSSQSEDEVRTCPGNIWKSILSKHDKWSSDLIRLIVKSCCQIP